MLEPTVQPPYREYRPAPDLAPYVDCFWSRLDAGAEPQRHRVLPDGCVDILFDLGPWRRGERPALYGFVVGTMTAAQIVETRGPAHLVAVRFRPGGAYAFFRRPIGELTDRNVALAELWPTESALVEGLARAGDDVRAQVQLLAARLRAELPRLAPADGRVRTAVDLLIRSGGRARVEELVRHVGGSRQHLGRRFHQAVGIGPKRLGRVLRLQRLLRLARAETVAAPGVEAKPGTRPNEGGAPATAEGNGLGRLGGWADLALAAGYYDQPHMNAETKALTGLTPTELLAGP